MDYLRNARSLSRQIRFHAPEVLMKILLPTILCGERERQLDNVPIAHLDDALAGGGCFGIVRNHDDGLVESIV